MSCQSCGGRCTCFTMNSETTISIGNGSQYAPFTFRPDYTPFRRPYGFAWKNIDQGLVNAASTVITFQSDSQSIGPVPGGNMFDPVISTTRITASVSGLYLVGSQYSITGNNVDQQIRTFIRLNGVTGVVTRTFVQNATNLSGIQNSISTLVNLTAGDYLELVMTVLGTSAPVVKGINADVGTGYDNFTYFWANWMGSMV